MKSITGRNRDMRNKSVNLHLWIVCWSFAGIAACSNPADTIERPVHPKVPVTVITMRTGLMADEVELSATSVFLDEAQIKSPVAAYVEKTPINPGDIVVSNEELILLRTKESVAIMKDSANPLRFSGKIIVRSSINGIVISVDHPEGDYVQEGDLLCRIAVPSSLVFIMEVPFESAGFIRLNSSCSVLLPDGRELSAQVLSRLPSMSQNTQTQRFVLKPLKQQNLPQNLIAHIRVAKHINPHAFILPKSCLLTDEVMKEFWVMKLINDSVAVKVSVMTGLSNADEIEIISPAFNQADRFLTSGNYGLGDTANVVVMQCR